MADRELNLFLKSYNMMGPGLGSAGSAIAMFSSSSVGKLSGLKKAFIGVGLAAGTVAGVMIMMAKRAIDLDIKMLDIKAAGQMTTENMLGMKDAILASSKAWGYSVDKVAEMSKGFVETSNDAAFLTKNMDFLAMTLAATRMAPEELGTSLGALKKDFKGTDDEFKNFIASIYSATQQPGREKTFQKLLPDMPKLMKAYLALRPGDMAGLQKFMTLAAFSPDPSTLVTAMRKLMTASISAAEKVGGKGKKGPLWALTQLGFGTTNVSKVGIVEIMERLNKITDKDQRYRVLAALLGKASLNTAELAKNYKDFEEAAKNVKLDALKKEAVENAQALSSAFESLKASMDAIAVKAMGPALKDLTKFLKDLNPEDIDDIAKAMSGLGKAFSWLITLIELVVKGEKGLMYGLFQVLNPGLAAAYKGDYQGYRRWTSMDPLPPEPAPGAPSWTRSPFVTTGVPSNRVPAAATAGTVTAPFLVSINMDSNVIAKYVFDKKQGKTIQSR